MLIALPSPLAAAAPPLPLADYTDLLNGLSVENDIYYANGACPRSPRDPLACPALGDIAKTIYILLSRDQPGGPSLLDPSKFNPAEYDARSDALLRAHPERNAHRCAVLAKIAANGVPWPRWPYELGRGFMWVVLELASRLRVGKRDCVAAVYAAMPNTGAAREIVAEARAKRQREHRRPL